MRESGEFERAKQARGELRREGVCGENESVEVSVSRG